jgi:hypothetical protein
MLVRRLFVTRSLRLLHRHEFRAVAVPFYLTCDPAFGFRVGDLDGLGCYSCKASQAFYSADIFGSLVLERICFLGSDIYHRLLDFVA